MKKNIITATLLLFGVILNAQTSKELKITELLYTMGSTQTMKTSNDYMIEYYKKSYPEISPEYWQEASKIVNYEDLIKKMVPLYSKHFTEQEIEDLLAFYRTTTGKKMINKMPLILQESMEIGKFFFFWGGGARVS